MCMGLKNADQVVSQSQIPFGNVFATNLILQNTGHIDPYLKGCKYICLAFCHCTAQNWALVIFCLLWLIINRD